MNSIIRLTSQERLARTKKSGKVSGHIQYAISVLQENDSRIAISIALEGLRDALRDNDEMFREEMANFEFDYDNN